MEKSKKVINTIYLDQYYDEKELLLRLFASPERTKLDTSYFSDLIYSPLDSEDYYTYEGFYITFNILREKLGLEMDSLPGDIDILIIPFDNKKVFFERTAVYEVKIVRPRRNNINKSPNSSGTKQIKGLINDGFPLIGLMHICMPEPLLENEKVEMSIISTDIDPEKLKGISDLREISDIIKIDFFPSYAMNNQMKKLLSYDIPKYIALTTFSLNVVSNSEFNGTFYLDFNKKFSSGFFNPHKKESTIELIANYWEKNKQMFRKLNAK